jgi:hypothetical protein
MNTEKRKLLSWTAAGCALAAVSGSIYKEVAARPGEARPRVIPIEVIREFDLRPIKPGSYQLWLLGADGQAYDLDAVFAAIFELLKPLLERSKRR